MTTTPDFQTLGAKIVELWDADCDIDVEINELRELLSTPPPEPPTDEELLRLYGVSTPCYHVEEFKRELNFARAVLDRWGK